MHRRDTLLSYPDTSKCPSSRGAIGAAAHPLYLHLYQLWRRLYSLLPFSLAFSCSFGRNNNACTLLERITMLSWKSIHSHTFPRFRNIC